MTFTQRREEELMQLINDVAENMNMSHWSKRDYCDAIRYLSQQSINDANRLNNYRDSVMRIMTDLIKLPLR